MENVDPIWFFIFALAGLICGVVATFMSRLTNIVAIGLSFISLAGVLAWWP